MELKAEKKRPYVDGMESLIKQWDETIKQMESKGAGEETVQDLRAKKDLVRHKLNALQKEGEDTWQNAVPELEKLKDDAAKAFDQASA